MTNRLKSAALLGMSAPVIAAALAVSAHNRPTAFGDAEIPEFLRDPVGRVNYGGPDDLYGFKSSTPSKDRSKVKAARAQSRKTKRKRK